MEFKTITKLADIMNQYGLTRLEVSDCDFSVCLSKEAPVSIPVAKTTELPEAAATAVQEAMTSQQKSHQIKAPMPGTFYLAPSPNAAPLVHVGDTVKPNTVVCIIEAMKCMSEIKAERGGKIIKVLVQNGSPVEYGQPLFEIEE